MQNLQEKLIEILKEDTTYFNNEKLLKNKLTEDALKLEPKLVKYILSDDKLKKHFFLEVDGVLFFDKDKFIQFVNDKQFLPDSYTSFKNKIGLLDENGDYFREKKDVVLAWPYKDCVLEGGQDKEEQKRDEIFYNEILAPDEIDRLFDPKVFTNFKRYDKNGEHPNPKDISRNDNLIIKGNNLLALHSLLKLYRGKVKLIYIDPPFNTGNDSFKYNDKFNHSSWLTFMKNRLSIAKDFLDKDGLIYIHLDEKELSYTRVLCDEVFKTENFISLIAWQRAPEGRAVLGQGSTFIIDSSEYILCYAKDKNYAPIKNRITKYVDSTEKAINQYNCYFISEGKKKFFKNIKDAKGNLIKIYKHEEYEFKKIDMSVPQEERIQNFKLLSRVAAQQEESSLQQKILSTINPKYLYSVEYTPTTGKSKGQIKTAFYINNGIILRLFNYAESDGKRIFRNSVMNNFWSNDEIQVTGISEEGGVLLRRGKKPEKLLQRIIEMSTEPNDLIMDFFLGSGTTSAVAHKIGRNYLGIEQLNYGKNDSVNRLKNVINGDQSGISKSVEWQGGGSFVYCELKKWNQNYIDEIETAKTTADLLSIYEKMKSEAFFRYDVDLSKFEEKEFIALTMEQQKEVLIECLDKNHLYVNLSEMEDATYHISDEEKEMNRKFYDL